MTRNIKIPESGVKRYIVQLATKYEVEYIKTRSSELAQTITKLSDDNVPQDDVERLVIALRQSGVISNKDVLLLLHEYLKEIKHV